MKLQQNDAYVSAKVVAVYPKGSRVLDPSSLGACVS